MRLFATIAEVGSLTGAARALGIPKQTLSRRLLELEETLGVELARRTTRRLVITDIGRAYAARCAEISRLAEEANRAAASQLHVVSGTLRVTADHSFGDAFLPSLVTAYLQANPDVDVDVTLTSRKVDLVEEGFDVAFRVGPPPDVTYLAARRLGPARLVTVAAPSYLAERGRPQSPRDLAEHDCIALVPGQGPTVWPLLVGGRLRMVPVSPRLRVNGLAIARNAAVSGLGLAHLPEFAAAAALADGRLVSVLDEAAPEVGGINIVHPYARLLAPKVSEFVSLAVETYGA